MPTVLLIDRPQASKTLAELLTTCGHRCQQAENAWQGLAALETSLIDLVVLQAQVPGLSGHGFLSDLRHHPNPRLGELPAIVLADSEAAELQARHDLRALRVSAFLNRQLCSPFEFLDTVRAALADPTGHRWRYAHVA